MNTLIYQIFGASIIIALIKYAIQVGIIALGVYIGLRCAQKKAKS